MNKTLTILLLFLVTGNGMAQQFSASGQIIGWTTVNPLNNLDIQGGIRYIPRFNAAVPLGDLNLEAEASLNAWGTTTYTHQDTTIYDATLDPYRVWIKLSGDQFELRAGLQKINFGSATLLRPLMWFDRIDPRDPLQLTDGVYGVLARYYFLNNANIWLWGLYGNNEIKGLEAFPSEKNSIEYGGRIQLPLLTGEIAATYHHRTADPAQVLPLKMETVPEDRFAMDAKFDMLAGVWLEGTYTRQQFSPGDPVDNVILNAGADYTFAVGNGLNVMAEGIWLSMGESNFSEGLDAGFGGMSLNYNIGLIHNLSAILFYDFTNQSLYRFVNWSVTFDKWTFYTMAFWNPENYQLINLQQDAGLFSGAGFQLMAAFNY